jgi:hypothetical protein
MSSGRREAGRLSPEAAELLEYRFAFDASWLSRATPFLTALVALLAAAVGYLGPGLVNAFFPGVVGAGVFATILQIVGLCAVCGGAIFGMKAISARAASYVTNIRVNEIGVYARYSLAGDIVFIPWETISWARFTRMLVHLKFIEGRDTRELRFLVPWRRTVDVIALKSFVLAKLRPSEQRPPPEAPPPSGAA